MIHETSINKKYYCYKITNNINNKIYIGKSNSNINRWISHLYTAKNINSKSYSYLHASINKYGKENFSYEILEYFDDESSAYNRETELILHFNSNKKEYGMNLNSGGRRPKHTKESIDKISQKRKGFKFSEESKLKMSISNSKPKKPEHKSLTDEQVYEIKDFFFTNRLRKIKAAILIAKIYEKYGCKESLFYSIITERNYSYVKYNKPKMPEGYSACSKCNNIKKLEEFSKSSKLPNGRMERCRLCDKSLFRNRNKK